MTTPSPAVEIYCREVPGQNRIQGHRGRATMKNGRAATRSTVCVECGTRKFRIGVLP